MPPYARCMWGYKTCIQCMITMSLIQAPMYENLHVKSTTIEVYLKKQLSLVASKLSPILEVQGLKPYFHPLVCTKMQLGPKIILCDVCTSQRAHVSFNMLTYEQKVHTAPSRFCPFHTIFTPLSKIFTTTWATIVVEWCQYWMRWQEYEVKILCCWLPHTNS